MFTYVTMRYYETTTELWEKLLMYAHQLKYGIREVSNLHTDIIMAGMVGYSFYKKYWNKKKHQREYARETTLSPKQHPHNSTIQMQIKKMSV